MTRLRNFETGQEFAIAVGSEYRRVDDAQCAHPQAGGERGDLFDDATLRRLVAHYAALPDLFAPDLELRFDERDHESGREKERRDDRKDSGQRDERNINGAEVEAVGEIVRREVTSVDVLSQFAAAVLAQPPIQLAAPDIDGDDSRRASLEQAIGKTARRSANVETDFPFRFDPEMVERGGQLQTAPADERRRL